MRKVMIVNPTSKLDKKKSDDLFRKARKICKELTRKEFDKGLKLFFAMHGHYPKTLKKVRANVRTRLIMSVGQGERITYKVPRSSRKHKPGTNTYYYHDMDKTELACDVHGNLMLVGSAKLADDGWVHG